MASCKGVITRIRETVNNIGKNAIDFVIISDDLEKYIENMYVLTKVTNDKKGITTTQKSDHNLIVTNMKFEWD